MSVFKTFQLFILNINNLTTKEKRKQSCCVFNIILLIFKILLQYFLLVYIHIIFYNCEIPIKQAFKSILNLDQKKKKLFFSESKFFFYNNYLNIYLR